MSKIVNRPIKVICRNQTPVSFYYGRKFVIERVQECWRERGQWWANEPERFVYHVIAAYSLFELHFLPQSGQWILYRLED